MTEPRLRVRSWKCNQWQPVTPTRADSGNNRLMDPRHLAPVATAPRSPFLREGSDIRLSGSSQTAPWMTVIGKTMENPENPLPIGNRSVLSDTACLCRRVLASGGEERILFLLNPAPRVAAGMPGEPIPRGPLPGTNADIDSNGSTYLTHRCLQRFDIQPKGETDDIAGYNGISYRCYHRNRV